MTSIPSNFVDEKRMRKDFESISVPSKDGVSHAPREFTDIKHIATAAKVLITAIMDVQQGD